jgi:hypothetical protein
MADEIPPAPSESTDDLTKSETIRITLPPKTDQPAVKRETVRINVPGKPAPKKETTKLTTAPASAGAPPTAPKPFIPPPPAPRSLPTVPPPAAKPLPGGTPPKPPTLGARPTVPLKPAPAPVPAAAPVAAATAAEPLTQRAASPKKETARITLPPEGTKSALPKATVKMQQTQPLAPRPSAIQQAPAVAQAPAASFSTATPSDPLLGPLSIGAVIAAAVAIITVFLAMSATSPQ